ncbi:MAG: NADH:ubiquinone reductase (Na(+)-transporting) subunit F [Lentisphaeria bacterium]|jgi:Na+-transporting NADH:ubiquinone oxidoreductase subunit F|nr:NADH:ubiquinone reductase (Na(+)-transporting) subunit F [Lentisphaeria bacterium]MDP7740350.1 NADH:ubiquinone reductase (Na(+)-transporting) subunit F [Lentisphaeria bacterium]
MDHVFIILAGTMIMIGLILILVLALLAASNKLVNTGKVKVVINDDENKSLEVEAGSTLLNTLSSNGLLLPSACGGGGTCGVCRCQVLEGGGDLLPTEEGHISRKDGKDQWRLSCQVKVKQDMRIQVPAEIFSINKWECEVVTNDNVATFIKELVLKLPEGENLDFESGGYIQIEVPKYEIDYSNFDVEEEYRGDWDRFNLWDLKAKNNETVIRAYSMANHPAEGNIVMLNIRIASPPPDPAKGGFMKVPPGIASSFVFDLKPGDKATVSGPYGEFFIQETEREMCYIGGGAGMAPLRSHIFHLFHTLKTGRKVSYWYGARSLREMFYEDQFRKIEAEFPNFKFHVALSDPLPEDNWDGHTGFIHSVVLDHYLGKHPAPEDIEYYLCGPPMMLSAVQSMLDDLGVEQDMIRFDNFG